MILHRQHFNLNDRCVLEKLSIQTPFRYSAVFPDKACFLHFKSGESVFSSPTEKLQIAMHESVLLKCGNYFSDLIQGAAAGACEIYVVHLYPEILRDIYKNDIPAFLKSDDIPKFIHKIDSQEIMDRFIGSLTFYFENPILVNEELIRLKLKELVLLLLQTKSADTISALLGHLFSPRQASITTIIQTHLYSNLSLDELAKLSGMSLSTFKREFQRHFNDSPASYIKQKKLLKAQDLLNFSELSISEISFQTGFNDPSHFSRSFTEEFHISPSEYRHR